MATLNEFPKIMDHAREDLCATVSGRFSPEDWQSILTLAEQKLAANSLSAADEIRAWQAVVLDFHQNAYWGFQPNYVKPKVKKTEKNFGIRFIVVTFLTFTFTKIALVWTGQIYTNSDDPVDKYIFLSVIVLVICNFTYLLWKTRHHKD